MLVGVNQIQELLEPRTQKLKDPCDLSAARFQYAAKKIFFFNLFEKNKKTELFFEIFNGTKMNIVGWDKTGLF